MPTKQEMEQQLADLRSELQSALEARQAAEERAQLTISALEGQLSTVTEAGQRDMRAAKDRIAELGAEVEALRKEVELLIVRGQEQVRQELDQAHRRELNTHMELQQVLHERVELRARLETVEQSMGGAPPGGRGEMPSPEAVAAVAMEDRAGRTRGVTGRNMKLPPLPEFSGSDLSDEGAYQRWLLKLEKHAELQE